MGGRRRAQGAAGSGIGALAVEFGGGTRPGGKHPLGLQADEPLVERTANPATIDGERFGFRTVVRPGTEEQYFDLEGKAGLVAGVAAQRLVDVVTRRLEPV